MTHRLLILLIAAICGLWGCATDGSDRVVERPVVRYATTNMLTIDRVELSDTATVVRFTAHFRPGWWVKIAPDSYLRVDGKEYTITDTCGFCPGQPIIMPDNGAHSFSISFEPIPADASSFDFIEGHETYDGFDLFGIDLTGSLHHFAVPVIPDTATVPEADAHRTPRIQLDDAAVPVKIQMLNWTPGLMDNVMLSASDFEICLRLDSTGAAQAELPLDFPQRVHVNSLRNVYYGSFVTAPGDTAIVYLDAMAGSDRARGLAIVPKRLWAKGLYEKVNECLDDDTIFDNLHRRFFAPVFKDYQQPGEKFVEAITDAYRKAYRQLASYNLSPMQADLAAARLDLALLLDAKDYREMFAIEYENSHFGRQLPLDSIKTTLSREHLADIGASVDAGNPTLLLLDSWKRGLYDGTYSGSELYDNLTAYAKAIKKARQGTLSSDDTQLPGMPHLAKKCKQLNDNIITRLKDIRKPAIERLPDTKAESIVEAIVARHPGKVVLVAFWNPMSYLFQPKEFNESDVVLVNITDTSCPLPEIYSYAACLKGYNYIVSEEQALELWRKYRIDTLPYYIIADRRGELYFGPDLRNYSWLLSKIEERL